jgi:hypothetical protein
LENGQAALVVGKAVVGISVWNFKTDEPVKFDGFFNSNGRSKRLGISTVIKKI